MIEKNKYDSDGSLDWKETYQYEYDKAGNWTKRIEFWNEIPARIYERKYEYYE
jgi:hypothetical protein